MTDEKKIIITGIRGFVGTNLKKNLKTRSEHEYHITGASRKRENLEDNRGFMDDICSYDELCKGENKRENKYSFDAYIHLAGKVIHDQQLKDSDEYFQVNYEQTKRIYNQFLADPRAKKFIFLSTIHVLTEKPDRVIDETFQPKPFTPYGKSKFDAENYIKLNAKPGKNYYILRPTMIHGPGNKGNLNLLYKMIERGFPYLLGSINNCRSFTSIDNLAFIIDELLQSDVEAGLYHIADDEPTYSHDLIRMIGSLLGKKVKIISVPLFLLKTIAKIGNYLKLPMNDHKLTKLTEDFIVSNEKIKKAIGKPLPVDTKKGLEKTLRSFSEG